MSDTAIIVAELSVSAQDAVARAVAAAAWLVEQGVSTPNAHPDRLPGPSRYAAGPAATSAAPGFEQVADLANTGIDIIPDRRVHDAGGNYEPPACPNCAVPLDEDTHFALVEPWLEYGEPDVTCSRCGATALVGDWPGPWALVVANLAVRFNNWPPLTDTFVNELSDRLGPRCRLIQQRI